MKTIKFIVLLSLSVILNSCSSSSDDNSDVSPNTFNYKVNGVVIPITNIIARKSENALVVSGVGANGEGVDVEFNKFGNLRNVEFFTMSDPTRSVFYDYSSNYFNFQLVSIDEVNKRVVVQFSGRLYEDDGDLTSNFVQVEGNFDVNYQDIAPNVPGLMIFAKIGGADWYSTKSYTTNGNGFDDFILRHNNDDQNQIGIGFDSTNNGIGTYNFTPSTVTNFVHLSKYDTTTNLYLEYNCTGTLKVTGKTPVLFGGYIIEGTYSFTAANPSNPAQQIQVTQGTFKTYYNW